MTVNHYRCINVPIELQLIDNSFRIDINLVHLVMTPTYVQLLKLLVICDRVIAFVHVLLVLDGWLNLHVICGREIMHCQLISGFY